MDYFGILKRAWDVTWRYKILWLFGLFAGTGGSSSFRFNTNTGGGGGGTGTESPGTTEALGQAWEAVQRQVESSLPIIVAVIVLISLIAIVCFILSIAAQGGLVHLVNEAEEKRSVKAGDGWRVGFSRWGRVFVLTLLVSLPILALTLVYLLLFGASLIGIIGGASAGGAGAFASVASAGGLCFGTVLFVVVAGVLGVILGIAGQLGLRYAILEDKGALESFAQGWADIWAKRGGFLMYLVMVVAGMVFGMAVAIVLMFLIAPAFVLLIVGNVGAFIALFVIAMLLAMLPNAIFGTFFSAAWTIFFRRMTGREEGYAVAAVPPAPPAPAATQADVWAAANEIPDSRPSAPPMPAAPPMPEPPPIPEAPPMPGSAPAEPVAEAVAPTVEAVAPAVEAVAPAAEAAVPEPAPAVYEAPAAPETVEPPIEPPEGA